MTVGYQQVPALRADLDRLVALIAGAPDLAAPVPGLDWTADQVATHVALAVRALAAAIEGDTASYTDMIATGDTTRETIANTNAKVLSLIRFTTPAEAAEAMRASGDALLTALSNLDPTAVRSTPWYGDGATRTAGTLAGVAHGEILMHGLDLARALGKPWPTSNASATGIAYATMTGMLPHLLKPSNFRGAFEIKLRGGPSFVLTIADGAVTVGTDPSQVDATISMDPVAGMLVGYGRMPQWKALMTGRIVAYGRRPWRALRFTRLFDRP